MAREMAVIVLASALVLASGGMTATAAEGWPNDITREELQALQPGPDAPLLLDVRSAEEFAAGHIPGALNVPHDQAAARLEELQPYRQRGIVLYCKSGRRAGLAAEVLAGAGFSRLRHLAGDMPGWIAAGLPVETAGAAH